MDRLRQLHQAGVSIWLDDLSRELLDSGEFMQLVREQFVTGATSNPTTFARAITNSERYEDQLRRVLEAGLSDPHAIFFELALEDVRCAADTLRAVYELSDGCDGFVSFQCTPDLADDAEATVHQALAVKRQLDVPNLLIKVAATNAGIRAVEELTAHGVSVNVTLLFSVGRYIQAMRAYWAGLARRAAAGESIAEVTSVASFFLSRIDAAVDPRLAPDSPLRGRIAVANAQIAYARHLGSLGAYDWGEVCARGARPQRLLWASTASKNPDYSDVRYVDELVAPGVINTMSQATLEAFADHGEVGGSLGANAWPAERLMHQLAEADVDFEALITELEHRGLESFRDSYRELLGSIERRVARVAEVGQHAHV